MTTPIYRVLPVVAAWWVVSKVTCANFDEYMTCGSGSERYGRHYHYNPNIPCDLSKDSFCDTPGTQYPWSAVRRFVYENQGLMKRMYGNQRHYNVLRSEVIHEMFEEMFDEMPKRQHHRYHPPLPSNSPSSNTRTARYHKSYSVNTLNSKNRAKSAKAAVLSGHQKSRAMKVTAEPEFRRPQMTSTTPKPKFQSKSPGNKLKTVSSLPSHSSTGTHTAGGIPDHKVTRTNTRRPQQATTNPSNDPITTSLEDTPTVTNENLWNFERDVNTNINHPDDITSLVQEEEEEEGEEEEEAMEESIHSTFFPPPSLGEMDLFEEDFWTTVEDMFTDTTTPYSTTYSDNLDDTFSTMPQQDMSTPPSTYQTDILLDDPENVESYFKDFISSPTENDDVTTLGVSEADTQEHVEDNPETNVVGEETTIDDDENVEPGINKNNMLRGNNEEQIETGEGAGEIGEVEEPELREEIPSEGVVHKDVLEDFREQESQKETMKIKRPIRGVNACPVKEEFIAPYWANNTRGETLALLNLYPFEQYVQWERCMYEHRQMYCRKGCRCEQQYRLQKLLAFDPTNECRGIFSDWFRFPSCCVCKCYDLPQDLLTGSARRPRYGMEDDYELESFEDDVQELDDADYEDDDDYKSADYDDEDDSKEESTESSEEERQLYRVKSGVRLVNIPPQRRPRLPPRPPSHIPQASHPSSTEATPSSNGVAPTINPSTLGTLDTATPHYFFNFSHHAQKFLGRSQPFPLSRIPRSNPEV